MKRYKINILLTYLFILLFFSANAGLKKESLVLSEKSKFMNINGFNIHYKIYEPEIESKANILFIHGIAASVFSWRKNIEFFSERGYRVLALDMPGYGYSEKNKPFDHSHESRAKLVWELMDSISDEKWILVGHSMGGGTAGFMAAMKPEKTEKLVFVDAIYGEFENNHGRTIARYFIRIPVVYHLIEGLGKKSLINYDSIEKFLTSAYGENPDSIAVMGYLEPFLIEGSSAAFFHTVFSGLNETEPDIDKIDMPVLLIWGENDTWVPLELGKYFHSKMDNSILKVIPDAGHNPMETHADDFNEILLRFIQKDEKNN